jgi:hypothetical protein
MNCVSRCSFAFEICLRRRLTTLWACIVGYAAIQMVPVAAAQTGPLWAINVSKSAMLRQTSGTTVEEDGSTIRITVNHAVSGISPHLNVELRGGGKTYPLERRIPYSTNAFDLAFDCRDRAEMERTFPDGNYMLVAGNESVPFSVNLDQTIYQPRVLNFDALQQWTGGAFRVTVGPTPQSRGFNDTELHLIMANGTDHLGANATLVPPSTTFEVSDHSRNIPTSPGDSVTGQIWFNDFKSIVDNSNRITVYVWRALRLRFPVARPPRPPTIATQPTSATVLVGAKTALAVTATSTGVRYQWQKDGVAIPGATNDILGFDPVRSIDEGVYAVTVSNPGGSVTSVNVRLIVLAALAPPVIITPPSSSSITVGSTASVTVVATGSPPLFYQWYRNGTPIIGAMADTHTISPAQLTDAGSYTVHVSNAAGLQISAAAVITVAQVARISNLSIRTTFSGNSPPLTIGLTISGEPTMATKPLLLRAVGPTLGLFGVTDALPDPRIAILSGPNVIAENDDWAGNSEVSSMSATVGAFTLVSEASKDAALVRAVARGGYTVRVSGASAARGVALAEVYDTTPGASFLASSPRLTNVSALTDVGLGGDILIAGFSIAGGASKRVLVRGVGPSLAGFGVTGVLADAKLELFTNGATTAMATNDNWSTNENAAEIVDVSASVGAFPLSDASKDAVLLLSLPSGSYTAQVSGVNTTTGTALVEVYEVP